jgi:2-iminobutanoate/2-iminopropanoate deaminase
MRGRDLIMTEMIVRTGELAGLPPPTGPWSWSVSWKGLVLVSGIRGIDPATGLPAPDDETRLKLIFHHMRRILEAAGSSLRAVLSSRVYVTDMARLRPLVNAAYIEAFGDQLPTRTIVEVVALNQGDSIEVEIMAVAEPRNSEGSRGSEGGANGGAGKDGAA